ncbi:hypothetical protein BG015_003115 [Linnemannia schmuckeri]|uniref:C2H2-type domain-containing protein n=1 Tax=Linnemannia schmuckeri TaxID=64567 RepID=A0A9P5S6A3_9FUNG|nr:hypothetical protein BG015_003115 [Linnemannia schmuckeri]
MDFSSFIATSPSDVFATTTSTTHNKETSSSVVIITNNNGASTGCFDASKSSKNNNSNSDTTTSTFPDVYFNNDMSNINNDDSVSQYYWAQLSADTDDLTGLDLTPELSPEMSNYSPAVDSVGSPYTYDPLGTFGDAASPSVDWHSPIEDPLAALNHFEADFDCSFPQEAVWVAQQDFELFPTYKDESAKLEKLLMDSQSATTTMPVLSALPTIKESPAESTFGAFSPVLSNTISPAMTTFSAQEIICPTTFSEAKLLGQDMQAPNYRVAPRKVTQSPTKAGFQPPKKTRRRRVTSEEASRVIPTDQMGDPNAKPRYKCSECGKTFSRPFNLRSHRDTHSGFRPFECPHKDKNGSKCKWSFARRHDLERHIISKHTKGKNFQCRTCGVECTRSDAFKRHLARNEQCNAAEAAADMELDSDQVSHL